MADPEKQACDSGAAHAEVAEHNHSGSAQELSLGYRPQRRRLCGGRPIAISRNHSDLSRRHGSTGDPPGKQTSFTRVLVLACAECFVLTFGIGACMRMLAAEVHVGSRTRLM